METIIKNIQEKLHSEVPELKYIDEDWGQLDEYAEHPPVKWPCALIDLPDIQFSNTGANRRKIPMHRQEGNGTISIDVANLKLTNSSHMAPAYQKEQARSIWNVVKKVHQVLQGFRPSEHSGSMIRTSINRLNREDGVQIYRISYHIEVYDV